MARRLYVNGEAVDVIGDNITAGQLKKECNFEQTSWVMVDERGSLRQLNDNEIIPAGVEHISILPAYEYGGKIASYNERAVISR